MSPSEGPGVTTPMTVLVSSTDESTGETAVALALAKAAADRGATLAT